MSILLVAGNNELNVSLTPVAAPPLFTGFSLMVKNPPGGTTYWVVSAGMFQLSEAWWYRDKTPAPYWLRIVFLNSNYQCPTGDPDCEGIDVWFAPEDGHHYLIDATALAVMENPSPPSEPPPTPTDEPRFISFSAPSQVSPGENISVTSTWFLPVPWKTVDTPVYTLVLYLPKESTTKAMDSTQIIHRATVLPHYCPYNPYVEGYLNGSKNYTFTTTTWNLHKLYTILGTYPIYAVCGVSNLIRCSSEDWEYTVPGQAYNFGIVGQMKVV